jgi:deuterolysin
LGFTLSPLNLITFCPSFFSLPDISTACHTQDKSTTLVHEYTHAAEVYAPATQDFAYGMPEHTFFLEIFVLRIDIGYVNVIGLPVKQKIINADSYGLFLNGKCKVSIYDHSLTIVSYAFKLLIIAVP